MGLPFYVVSREKGETTLSYEEVNEHVIRACKLIINTTPLGMYPDVNSFPPLPYEAISEEHLLYDLVYNPEKSLFLKKGEENGASVMNGLDMLKLQAEAAWRIWNEGLIF
jgi:shikimate dehydrogenase